MPMSERESEAQPNPLFDNGVRTAGVHKGVQREPTDTPHPPPLNNCVVGVHRLQRVQPAELAAQPHAATAELSWLQLPPQNTQVQTVRGASLPHPHPHTLSSNCCVWVSKERDARTVYAYLGVQALQLKSWSAGAPQYAVRVPPALHPSHTLS